MSETIDFLRNPLDSTTAAAFAEDGRFTITFADVKEAKAWALRFFWAKEREKKKSRKAARDLMTKAGQGNAQDFEWIEEYNARADRMDEFHASREGATVTVMSFRKNAGVVAVNGVPVGEAVE